MTKITVLGGNPKMTKLCLTVVPDAEGTVDVCRVCGKSLVDHTSITTGVGPVCAKNLGIHKAYKDDIKKFMSELKVEFDKVGPTELTLWSASIKGNQDLIMKEVSTLRHSSQPVGTAIPMTIVGKIDLGINWLRYYPDSRTFVMEETGDGARHDHLPGGVLPVGYRELYNKIQDNGSELEKHSVVNIINPDTGNQVLFNWTGSKGGCWCYNSSNYGGRIYTFLIPRKR